MRDWAWERKACGQETVVASHSNTADMSAWGVNGHSKERHSLTLCGNTSLIALSVARLSTWLCSLVIVHTLFWYWCLWCSDGLFLNLTAPRFQNRNHCAELLEEYSVHIGLHRNGDFLALLRYPRAFITKVSQSLIHSHIHTLYYFWFS